MNLRRCNAQNKYSRKSVVFFLATLFLILASCARMGPQAVAPERVSYNRVIQYNEKQQLLLNIVRLRYGDIPYFITFESLVSQFQFESSASLDAIFTSPLTTNQLEPNIGIRYNESPTLTYMPLTGSNYIKRFLTPINIRVLYSLLQSNWGVNHVFRLIVQRIGSIENAVAAARSASSTPPQYKEFMHVGNIIRKLEKQGKVLLDYDVIDKDFVIKVSFKQFASYPADWKKHLRKINVTAKTPYVWLMTQNQQKYPHVLFIQTRTTLGLLNYLSKGVEVPLAHIKQEFAPMTRLPNGQLFDWSVLTYGLMKIKSSPTCPRNSFVAVDYKGYWFYVDQSDTNSKETFNLLNILMEANNNNNYKKAPVFTIR